VGRAGLRREAGRGGAGPVACRVGRAGASACWAEVRAGVAGPAQKSWVGVERVLGRHRERERGEGAGPDWAWVWLLLGLGFWVLGWVCLFYF